MMTKSRVVIVLDAEYEDKEAVLENAPTFVESALGRDLGPNALYRFSDPTVYVGLEDFDADRAEGTGAFEGEPRTEKNEPIETPEGVTYEQWSDGYAVGFKATHEDGRVEYIYLNPSSDDSDGVPNVFVYKGTAGDPAEDDPAHYYAMLEGPEATGEGEREVLHKQGIVTRHETRINARLDLAAELATGIGPGAAESMPGFEDEVGWRFDRIDEDLAEVEAYAAGYAKLPELAQATKLATVAGFKLRRLVDGADPATLTAQRDPIETDSCRECGGPIYQDESPGVWLHEAAEGEGEMDGHDLDAGHQAVPESLDPQAAPAQTVRPGGSWAIWFNGEADNTFREALRILIDHAVVWVSFEDGRSGEYEVIAVGAGLTLRSFTAPGTEGPDDDTEYALEDITEVLVY